MRTVMMDVDGVLVCGRPQDGAHLFTDLEKDLGISLKALQAGFFAPRWQAIVTGKRALESELAEALAEIAPDVAPDTLIDYWFRNDSRIEQPVLDAIDDVRRQGVRVFLATNQEHRRADYLMTTLGLGAHVDGIAYSAAIGSRKPDPVFFSAAAALAGSRPEETVLVDDLEENVSAAHEAGWLAVHWKPGMSMSARLASVLVP